MTARADDSPSAAVTLGALMCFVICICLSENASMFSLFWAVRPCVFRLCRVSLLWERLMVWLWSLVSLNCNTVYLHLHCQQYFSLRITLSLYHQWTRNKPINRSKPQTLDLLIDRNLDLTADVCIEDTQQWFSQLQHVTFSVSVVETQMKDTQWLSHHS